MKKASKGGRRPTRKAKVTGFGLMAGAGMTAWRRRRQRDHLRPFLEWDGPSDAAVDVGVARIVLPIRYWRTDCFLGVFPADYGAVRDMLPSSRLHPMRLLGSKAAIAVVAYDYIETGVGPYGEIGLVPLCTLDRAAPPMLPLLQDRWRGIGGFVAHLPVTSRVACEAGRSIWGYPKFVADMAFDVSPERQEVTLAEAGREILRLGVRRAGRVALERAPLTTFTVRGDRLIRTTVALRGYVALSVGGSGGELTLGDHPVGRELAALGLGTRPVVTKTYLTHTAILPAGDDIGPADRPYTGYEGEPREVGTHTIRYDDDMVRVVTQAEKATAAMAEGGE
jgi:hypothetical protein